MVAEVEEAEVSSGFVNAVAQVDVFFLLIYVEMLV